MAIESVHLDPVVAEHLAALRPAHREMPTQGRRVRVQGTLPIGEDEVLLLVLSTHGGFLERRTLHAGPVNLRELLLRLAGAEAAVERLVKQRRPTNPPLTPSEASTLDEAGLPEDQEDVPDAIERSQIDYELLLRDSFSLEEAAKKLSVSTGRLRQRLSPQGRSLYGIKDGRSWRIPKFQFDSTRKKLIPGIDKVLPHVRRDAHPLAVVSWFCSPHQDLVVGEAEKPIPPLAWLSGGNSAQVVADLAEEI